MVAHANGTDRVILSFSKDPEKVLGWTIFDRLYILNGTVYVVTDEPDKFPVRENMTSNAGKIQGGIPGEKLRLPSDRDMRIIGRREAKYLFGTGASIIDGVTVCLSRISFESIWNPPFFTVSRQRSTAIVRS